MKANPPKNPVVETFLTIAKAFATPPKKRTEMQERLAADGICVANIILNLDWCTDTLSRCKGIIISFGRRIRKRGAIYWAPVAWQCNWSRKHDLLRAKWCRQMAAIARKQNP